MIHLHATRKLLNLGKIDGKVIISEQPIDQLMHDWYVTIMGSSFRGKMLVIYVHEASLMTIITRGRTIKTTSSEFKQRLERLLIRYGFPETFIKRELAQADEMVVGKTTNKSTLAYINQIIYLLDYWVFNNYSYESINLDDLENKMMNRFFSSKKSNDYITPFSFWEEKIGCKLFKSE